MTANEPVLKNIEPIVQQAKRLEEDLLHSSKGHYNACAFWRNIYLGVGGLASTLAIASSFSAYIEQSIVVIVLSLVVAVLTGLMTFIDPNNRYNSHKTAGATYGALMNKAKLLYEVELCYCEPSLLVDDLRTLYDRKAELDASCPAIPDGAYKKAKQQIAEGAAEYSVDS